MQGIWSLAENFSEESKEMGLHLLAADHLVVSLKKQLEKMAEFKKIKTIRRRFSDV